MKHTMEPEDEIRSLNSDLASEEARFMECRRQRDELVEAARIAVAEVADCKVHNYRHAKLDAALDALRSALARCEKGDK